MHKKQLVVLLMLLPALFTVACQSVNSFELPAFLQAEDQNKTTQSWPKLTVGNIQPVENTGRFIVPIETIKNSLLRDSAVLPPLPLEPVVSISTAQTDPITARRLVNQLMPPLSNELADEYILHNIASPTLTSNVLKIPAGKPQQINSFHQSTEPLETIKISVNGQPLVSGPGIPDGHTFPAKLMDVRHCTDQQWQKTGTGLSLLCATVEKTNVVSPSEIIPTEKIMMSLIVTGGVPGLYNLSLSTTDAAGREEKIIQQIEVIKPTP